MRRMYHVASEWTNDMARILNSHGVEATANGQIMPVQIDETTYLKLKPYFDKWNIIGFFYPEFSKAELKEAALSAQKTTHTHSYPMPDLNFGYRQLTYDINNYCEKCGIGLKQKDAFYIKSEPNPGKKRIFSLGWIYDELFVDLKLYNEVFKPLGVECREVVKYKNNSPFENTVQLVLAETTEKLKIENWPKEICTACSREKYQPMAQDFFPLYNRIDYPIFKSADYFGSGANAFKRIFLTKDLREELIKLKIQKPDWYFPCKS